MTRMRPPPTPMMRIGLLVVSGVLLTAAALWAGSVGPWTARPPAGSTPRSPPRFTGLTSLPRLTLPTLPTLSNPAGPAVNPSSNPGPVLYVVGGVLLLAVALMAAAMLRGRRNAAIRPDPEPASDTVQPGVPPPDPERPFDTREAADYVIACWDQLEQLAAARGTGRRREHTPTEFLRSLESVYPLDRVASAELLGLYQRARFDHVRLLPDTAVRARVCTATLIAAVSSVPVPQ